MDTVHAYHAFAPYMQPSGPQQLHFPQPMQLQGMQIQYPPPRLQLCSRDSDYFNRPGPGPSPHNTSFPIGHQRYHVDPRNDPTLDTTPRQWTSVIRKPFRLQRFCFPAGAFADVAPAITRRDLHISPRAAAPPVPQQPKWQTPRLPLSSSSSPALTSPTGLRFGSGADAMQRRGVPEATWFATGMSFPMEEQQAMHRGGSGNGYGNEGGGVYAHISSQQYATPAPPRERQESGASSVSYFMSSDRKLSVETVDTVCTNLTVPDLTTGMQTTALSHLPAWSAKDLSINHGRHADPMVAPSAASSGFFDNGRLDEQLAYQMQFPLPMPGLPMPSMPMTIEELTEDLLSEYPNVGA